jgi:hypothetical protein
LKEVTPVSLLATFTSTHHAPMHHAPHSPQPPHLLHSFWFFLILHPLCCDAGLCDVVQPQEWQRALDVGCPCQGHPTSPSPQLRSLIRPFLACPNPSLLGYPFLLYPSLVSMHCLFSCQVVPCNACGTFSETLAAAAQVSRRVAMAGIPVAQPVSGGGSGGFVVWGIPAPGELFQVCM